MSNLNNGEVVAPLRILRAARELLSDPTKWTKGAYARNQLGYCRMPTDSDTVCWCSIGALSMARSCDPDGASTEWIAIVRPLSSYGHGNVANFNDDPNTTHDMVIAAFDRAIESLEGNQPTSHEATK